ncbi:MAG: thioredoxin domain-containing protein [Anaerolineae bacterium]
MSDQPQPQPIKLPDPPPVPEKPRRTAPDDAIVLNQQSFFNIVIAVVFFVAGFIVAWVSLTATLNTALSQVKADVSSIVSQSVSTAVSGIQINSAVAMAPTPTITPVPNQNVDIGDAPSWGPADAKVTVIEFSDFQCPYCEIFYNQTYTLLKQQYGDKIRFVFKHFPLTSIHPQAYPAALASECAREQGKFWEYHDVLFQNQGNLFPDALITYANNIGVPNMDQFQKCVADAKYADRVEKDFNQAITHFATGTPTFYINGKHIGGAASFAMFSREIEAALAQAGG